MTDFTAVPMRVIVKWYQTPLVMLGGIEVPASKKGGSDPAHQCSRAPVPPTEPETG